MRFIIFFIFCSLSVFSQQSTQQLAYQYYINGEYDKAIFLYKELIDTKFSIAYYDPYFYSLIQVKEYKKAELLVKKMIRKYPKNLKYQLEIAIMHFKSGNKRKSESAFQKVMAKVNGDKKLTIKLAGVLNKHRMFENALFLYLEAEKISPKNHFSLQKAQLYSELGNSHKMILSYLEELKRNSQNKPLIINKLQKFMDNDGLKSDDNYKLVKKTLLKYISQDQDRVDYIEILIWVFMQNQQFKMALTQGKALDKRLQSNGEDVYDLAETFLDKGHYDLAVEAYDYVIDKGNKNYLYIYIADLTKTC